MGSAYPYAPLARKLGLDQPFYAFQQFELYGRSELFASVEAMAATYVDAIRMVRQTGPYIFAGMCSIGAFVAYEMAQMMLALGEEIELVILFDPMNSEVAEECSRSRALVDGALEVAHRMAGLPDMDAHLAALREELAQLVSELGLEPQLLGFAPRRLCEFLELFAANHNASLRYSPRPYPGRACIFISGRTSGDDRLLSKGEWSALVPAVEMQVLPIRHAELFSDPEIVAHVAAVLQAALDTSHATSA